MSGFYAERWRRAAGRRRTGGGCDGWLSQPRCPESIRPGYVPRASWRPAWTGCAATHVIYQALRDGTWIPGQRQRLQQLASGTWDQALAGVLGGSPGRQDDDLGQAIVEIAIYPDVVWLTARSLRAHSASHRAGS